MDHNASGAGFGAFSLTVSIEEGSIVSFPDQPDFEGAAFVTICVGKDTFKTKGSEEADWNESFTFNEATWENTLTISTENANQRIGSHSILLSTLQSRYQSRELSVFYGWVKMTMEAEYQAILSQCSLKISIRVNPSEAASYKRIRSQSSMSYKMLGSTGDPFDEQEQSNAFTGWINITIASLGITVKNLIDDLKTGTILIKLMECLTRKKTSIRYWERATTRMQMIENVKIAFQRITEYGVKLVGCNIEDVVDGNRKIVLGLIWSIVRQAQQKALKEISEQMQVSSSSVDARTYLLDWSRDTADSYYGTDIQDLTKSFQDGMAFCALLHAYRPELLDYDAMSRKLPVDRLEVVFNIMNEKLGLGRLQNPMEFLNQAPDEKAMMTYLWSLHQKLNDIGGREDTGVANDTPDHSQLWDDLVDISAEIGDEFAYARVMLNTATENL